MHTKRAVAQRSGTRCSQPVLILEARARALAVRCTGSSMRCCRRSALRRGPRPLRPAFPFPLDLGSRCIAHVAHGAHEALESGAGLMLVEAWLLGVRRLVRLLGGHVALSRCVCASHSTSGSCASTTFSRRVPLGNALGSLTWCLHSATCSCSRARPARPAREKSRDQIDPVHISGFGLIQKLKTPPDGPKSPPNSGVKTSGPLARARPPEPPARPGRPAGPVTNPRPQPKKPPSASPRLENSGPTKSVRPLAQPARPPARPETAKNKIDPVLIQGSGPIGTGQKKRPMRARGLPESSLYPHLDRCFFPCRCRCKRHALELVDLSHPPQEGDSLTMLFGCSRAFS